MEQSLAIASVRHVGPDTVAIEFDSPPDFSAFPGQFVRLSATLDGEDYARFYTISSPDTAETFEVTVGIDPEGGPFSQWLANRTVGDEMDVAGPYGSAAYESGSPVLVLGGGPGVGPAVGIGERALQQSAAVAIVYQSEEPAHLDRLARLARAGEPIYVVETAIEAALQGLPDEFLEATVYIYGFESFIDTALPALEATGFDYEGANVENFG